MHGATVKTICCP